MWGVQVTIGGQDMVTLTQPVYYLSFETSPSGSRTFAVPSGTTLKYMTGTLFNGAQSQVPVVTINGNSATWSRAGVQNPVIFYSEK